MIEERHVALFRNGRNQAIRIPREFELDGTRAIMRKDGDKLIIEPLPAGNALLAILQTLKPIKDRLPVAKKNPFSDDWASLPS
jgi:antitoxin VapB